MTLRIQFKIVPFGDEDKAYEIKRFDIFNKGRVDFGHCEYGVIELDWERSEGGLYTNTVLHRRDLGAVQLFVKAAQQLDLR